MSSIPIHNLNVPNGGLQQPAPFSSTTPVYSSYTGNLIGKGPIQTGKVKTDVTAGHSAYDKTFNVIVYNPANNSHMAYYDPIHTSNNTYSYGGYSSKYGNIESKIW